MTLPRIANSLNSFIMLIAALLFNFFIGAYGDGRQLGRPASRFGYCGVKRNSSRKRRVSRRFDSSMNDIIAGVSAACAWLIAICVGGGRSRKAAQTRK